MRESYDSGLLPQLTELEKQRLMIVPIVGAVGLVIFLLAVFVLFLLHLYVGLSVSIFRWTFIAGAIVLAFVMYKLTRSFQKAFKHKVIRRIVSLIDENLKYEPEGFIPKSDFVASSIFLDEAVDYKGDDLVMGKVGVTNIKFSELTAGKRVPFSFKEDLGIFHGLFLVADFNKDFKGRVVVLPDTAERLFGQLGKAFQSWTAGKRGELVKLENVEFEKLFCVYADDQVEARYILSTNLMERIVNFKSKTHRRMYMSFVGSKMYVAVCYKKDLFEADLFDSLLDYHAVRKYYYAMKLMVDVVEDLNLNTRIWTKE